MKKNVEKGYIPLSELEIGRTASVQRIDADRSVKLRLCDLGLNIGADVICLGASPFGDPRAYSARGRIIAVRGCDAQRIVCKV